MSVPMLRVMLVDDHEIVRLGFRMLLDTTPDIRVVAEAESGEAALRLQREREVDAVAMDISMSGITGIETTRQMLARDGQLRIMGLSAFEDPSYVRHLLRAGAMGYLSKRSDPNLLAPALRDIAAGKRYLDPRLAQRMALEDVGPAQQPLAVLSEREFEVFLHLARGESVNDIAARLHLSPRTVGTHLYHVKQKLDARNQSELTLLAIRHQLLDV